MTFFNQFDDNDIIEKRDNTGLFKYRKKTTNKTPPPQKKIIKT